MVWYAAARASALSLSFALPFISAFAILMVRSPKEGRRINTVWDRTRSLGVPLSEAEAARRVRPKCSKRDYDKKPQMAATWKEEGSIGSIHTLRSPPEFSFPALVCSILCEHGAQRGARACTMPFSPSFYLRSPVPLSIRVSARAVVSPLCVPTTTSSSGSRRDFDRQTKFSIKLSWSFGERSADLDIYRAHLGKIRCRVLQRSSRNAPSCG